jgi:hypothetical protein
MTDATKIDKEVKDFKKERHNWKMGLEHKSLNETEFTAEMKIKYAYLLKSSETLFKSVMNGTLDDTNYHYILNMLIQVNENKMSMETASVQVGEKYFKQYVEPLVEKEKQM